MDTKIYRTTQHSLTPQQEMEEPTWPLGRVADLLDLQSGVRRMRVAFPPHFNRQAL